MLNKLENQVSDEKVKNLQFENHVKEVINVLKKLPLSYALMVLKTAINKAESSAIIPD